MSNVTHIKVTAYTGRSFTERIVKINANKTHQEQVNDIISLEGLDKFQNIVWDLCDADGNVADDSSSLAECR